MEQKEIQESSAPIYHILEMFRALLIEYTSVFRDLIFSFMHGSRIFILLYERSLAFSFSRFEGLNLKQILYDILNFNSLHEGLLMKS